MEFKFGVGGGLEFGGREENFRYPSMVTCLRGT